MWIFYTKVYLPWLYLFRPLSCVLPQIAFPRFPKVTLATVKIFLATVVTKNEIVRLFTSVYLMVDSQIIFLWLVLTTLAASISFFTVIWSLVLFQMVSKNISKFALFASQGLLSSMFHLVLPHPIYIKWDKVANFAFFRFQALDQMFHPTVFQHVRAQIASLWKYLSPKTHF